MAKTALEQWDETAANNTDVGGIVLSDSTQIDALDNIEREHMSQIAKWLGDDTLASAATTDLGSVPGRYVSVTGTTTITALGTIKAGTIKYVKFTGALTFTHNATSLILPGAANITTAAGDTAIMVSEGSGNWRCMSYARAFSFPPFTKQYVSGNQTITLGSVLAIAHGLGVAPKLVAVDLVCLTAELGYSIGAVISINLGQMSTSIADAYGMAVLKDATNVTLVTGSAAGVFNIIRADTFAAATITAANWALVVRAWA